MKAHTIKKESKMIMTIIGGIVAAATVSAALTYPVAAQPFPTQYDFRGPPTPLVPPTPRRSVEPLFDAEEIENGIALFDQMVHVCGVKAKPETKQLSNSIWAKVYVREGEAGMSRIIGKAVRQSNVLGREVFCERARKQFADMIED